jgi:hypothetical protein
LYASLSLVIVTPLLSFDSGDKNSNFGIFGNIAVFQALPIAPQAYVSAMATLCNVIFVSKFLSRNIVMDVL